MKTLTPLATVVAISALVLSAYLYTAQRQLHADLVRLQAASIQSQRQLITINLELTGLQQTSLRLAQLAVTHERALLAPALPPPSVPRASEARTDHPSPPAAGTASPAPALPPGLHLRPSTRILVNGRDMAVDGHPVDEADLRDLPPANIERIEVLPAIPGASPTAPTMNVVLRPDAPTALTR